MKKDKKLPVPKWMTWITLVIFVLGGILFLIYNISSLFNEVDSSGVLLGSLLVIVFTFLFLIVIPVRIMWEYLN